MNYIEEQSCITDAISLFPDTFGLRHFPGETFRMSARSSYIDDEGNLKLYTQRLVNGEWLDFAKGTVSEMQKEVVDAPIVNSCDKCRQPATATADCPTCSKTYRRCDEHGARAGCLRSIHSHSALYHPKGATR